MLQLFKLNKFYSPEEAIGTGNKTPVTGDNKEDIIEFLGEEDDKEIIDINKEGKDKGKEKEPAKDKGKDKTSDSGDSDEEDTEHQEEDAEVDELAELEDELNPPTEEQLELVTPVRRREILKKYPSLFKEFPYLEKAYYREQQFTEIVPTIADAKMAVEKAQTLDNFEQDIMKGNTEVILKSVKESNPNAFAKIVDDYLPTLAKVDEKAYYHVLGNVTKQTIIAMVGEAKRLGVGEGQNGVALQNAALLLNQFIFGSSEFKPPTQLATDKVVDGKDKEISEREQKIIRTQFDNARNDLNTRVNNTLKNTIDANIDPKNSMSDYVRRNASRDAMETLESLIVKDTRFKTIVDKLWEGVYKDNFSKESLD